MKKIYFLICLSIASSFTACESNYVSHQNVGKHVFQTLQTLDTLSKETFYTKFVSLKELKNMVQNIKEGNKLIPKIAEMTNEAYQADISDIYDNIILDSENNYIRWENTEFVDYKYQTSRNRSMTLNHGTLFFKHNEEDFSVGVYWITDLNTSGLLGLGGLQRVE